MLVYWRVVQWICDRFCFACWPPWPKRDAPAQWNGKESMWMKFHSNCLGDINEFFKYQASTSFSTHSKSTWCHWKWSDLILISLTLIGFSPSHSWLSRFLAKRRPPGSFFFCKCEWGGRKKTVPGTMKSKQKGNNQTNLSSYTNSH